MKRVAAERWLLVAILIVTLAVDFAVVFLNLYGWYGRLDIPTHALNTFTITLIPGLLFYRSLFLGNPNRLLVVAVISLAGLGIGALFEVAEWAMERALQLGGNGARTDTVGDLLADSMGAFCAGLALVIRNRARQAVAGEQRQARTVARAGSVS